MRMKKVEEPEPEPELEREKRANVTQNARQRIAANLAKLEMQDAKCGLGIARGQERANVTQIVRVKGDVKCE